MWKTVVPGYYEVSNLGRVRSLDRVVERSFKGPVRRRGKILRPKIDSEGYHIIGLSVRGVVTYPKIHRLVALHFLPPSDLPEINHKDLDKSNNAALNLEWTTTQRNTEHARCAGRMAQKLNWDKVAAIRRGRNAGLSYTQLGAWFGISKVMARNIVIGRSWKERKWQTN